MEKQIQKPLYSAMLFKRALAGAVPALLLMILFLSGVHHPDPDWGRFWYIRPLIVITFAGAAGGAVYHFLDHVSYEGGWKRLFAILFSILIYIAGLWMGTVLGLVGTLWN